MSLDDDNGNHAADDIDLDIDLDAIAPNDAEELVRLRSFCAMLPETTEVDVFGVRTFRVAVKGYAMFELADGYPIVTFRTTVEYQAELVVRTGFTVEPDTGHHGWTQARVSGPAAVSWDEVDELVINSYRLTAPPEYVLQLNALLDGG